MRTREQRIKQVERNLVENQKRFASGVITETQFLAIRKDGNNCLREIKTRPAAFFKKGH